MEGRSNGRGDHADVLDELGIGALTLHMLRSPRLNSSATVSATRENAAHAVARSDPLVDPMCRPPDRARGQPDGGRKVVGLDEAVDRRLGKPGAFHHRGQAQHSPVDVRGAVLPVRSVHAISPMSRSGPKRCRSSWPIPPGYRVPARRSMAARVGSCRCGGHNFSQGKSCVWRIDAKRAPTCSSSKTCGRTSREGAALRFRLTEIGRRFRYRLPACWLLPRCGRTGQSDVRRIRPYRATCRRQPSCRSRPPARRAPILSEPVAVRLKRHKCFATMRIIHGLEGHSTTARHYGFTKEPPPLEPAFVSIKIEYKECICVKVLSFVLAAEIGDHH